MKKADTLRALSLLTLIVAAEAGLIVLSVNEPLREALGESLGRFRGWAWGPVVFAAVYALACLVIPGSLITLAAGSLFGVVVGTAVVSLASVTGASLPRSPFGWGAPWPAAWSRSGWPATPGSAPSIRPWPPAASRSSC